MARSKQRKNGSSVSRTAGRAASSAADRAADAARPVTEEAFEPHRIVVHQPAPWVRLIDAPGTNAASAMAALNRLIVQATAIVPYRLTPCQIRFTRAVLNLSNAQLSDELRVSPWTVCRWQSDRAGQRPTISNELNMRQIMQSLGEDRDTHLGLGKAHADRLVRVLNSPAGKRGGGPTLTFQWLPDDPAGLDGSGSWRQLADARWLVQEGVPAGPTESRRDSIVFSGCSDAAGDDVGEAWLNIRAQLRRGDTLDLVSPYLSVQVLEAMTKDVDFRLITDLDACLDANPCQRLRSFLEAHADRIRNRPGVHCKLVLHNCAGMTGSANLTVAAAQYRDETCFVAQTPEMLRPLHDGFARLWAKGEPLRVDQLRAGASSLPSSRRRESSTSARTWFRSARSAARAIAAKQRELRSGAAHGATATPSPPSPATPIITLHPSPAEVMVAEAELLRAALERTTSSSDEAGWLLDRMADVGGVADLAPDDPRVVQPGCKPRSASVYTLVNRRRVIQVDRSKGRVALLLSELPRSFCAKSRTGDGEGDRPDAMSAPTTTAAGDACCRVDALESRRSGARTPASIAASLRRRRATPTRVGIAEDVDEGVFISYRHANGFVTVTMPFHVARRFWDEIEPLWHDAVSREVLSCRASSHRCRHSRNVARLIRSDDARSRIAAAVETLAAVRAA